MTVVSTINDYSECNILHQLVPAFNILIAIHLERNNNIH
jgi:hypothetical protein